MRQLKAVLFWTALVVDRAYSTREECRLSARDFGRSPVGRRLSGAIHNAASLRPRTNHAV